MECSGGDRSCCWGGFDGWRDGCSGLALGVGRCGGGFGRRGG